MDLEKVRMDEERVSMYLKKVRTDDDRVKMDLKNVSTDEDIKDGFEECKDG